jgi:glutathione S-transferase
MTPLPILYSFRRCPYAMRARMAIIYSGIHVELREVVLKNKPAELISASAKGTVPVLQLQDGHVIDESLDIMRWALQQHDPGHWLSSAQHPLLEEHDSSFKQALDRYKYADRFPEQPQYVYRQTCEAFLNKIEHLLAQNTYIQGACLSYVDIAIAPFIRQFAWVDKAWFDTAPYPYLQRWLSHILSDDIFLRCMQTYPAWQAGDKPVIFP